MLDDFLRRFRTGYKICYEAVEHKVDPSKSKASENIHVSRIRAFEESQDPVEALGYLAAMGIESLRHPVTMYKTMASKGKSDSKL